MCDFYIMSNRTVQGKETYSGAKSDYYYVGIDS